MKRWKPTKGTRYWVVSSDSVKFIVMETHWDDDNADKQRYASFNCFETRAKAEAAVKAMQQTLERGEPTVFNRITLSPEKLADSILIEMEDFTEWDERRVWWESPIMQGHIYRTRQEAYEATLARLKDVYDE